MPTPIDPNTDSILCEIIDRIEALEDEKSELGSAITQAYKDASASGFNAKALRLLIRLRKLERDERDEMLCDLDCYIRVTGGQLQLDFGQARKPAA